MPEDGSAGGRRRRTNAIAHLEDELTAYLERANELRRRVKHSRDALEEELRRTRQIAEAIRGVADDRQLP